jgi:hypothetical protein
VKNKKTHFWKKSKKGQKRDEKGRKNNFFHLKIDKIDQ